MTKDKGKSRRRRTDWQQKYLAGEDLDESPTAEPLRRRAVKLPPARLENPQENLDELPKTEGIVTGLFPGGAVVRIAARHLLCGIAGTYRPPQGATALAVGDIVTVALVRQEHTDGQVETDKDRADGVILARQPRRTVLARPQPQSAKRRKYQGESAFEKVIVANMDVLLIVGSTAEPPLRKGLIDRFLIVAERGQLEPVVVINKIDLAEPDAQAVADLRELQIQVFVVSALTGEGLEALRTGLAGRNCVLAGASGVGKSTLINALVPGAAAATRSVRPKDRRGRHLTSSAAMYDLPEGGVLVDTPGVRELGVNLTAAELPWYFPEFEAVANECKFNNCTHIHEPDCAVIAAVRDGRISRRRYEGYLRIVETLPAFK